MAQVLVTKDYIPRKIFLNVRDIINSNISNITTTYGVTIQTLTSAFPDKEIDNKASYPIVVVNPISFKQDSLTMGKVTANPTCIINVYSTSAEDLDKIMSALIYYITANKKIFRCTCNTPLTAINSAGADTVIRSGMKIHNNNLVLTFRFDYDW